MMKRYSSKLLLPLLAFSLVLRSMQAAEPASTNAAPAENQSEALRSNPQELQSQARFLLFKELAALHTQRAEDARKANERDKTKWEEDLARELSDKASETVTVLEGLTRERITQSTNAPAATPAEATNPDEAAYLTRLDTHLWRLEQDIKAALETNKSLSARLQTNNTPEDVLRVSFAAQENNTIVRLLERERSNLELQKLQYRALKSSNP